MVNYFTEQSCQNDAIANQDQLESGNMGQPITIELSKEPDINNEKVIENLRSTLHRMNQEKVDWGS